MSTARHFGSGVLIGTPSGANPTPKQFGTLQDVSVDFSFGVKPLMGQFQMPVAQGRGSGKISGSAKFADMDAAVFNTLFFSGVTPVVGQKLVSYQEGGTIPSTPFAVTVINSATFDADLGVAYASNGKQFTRVASAPTVGQYTVAAGVYTFAAADTGLAVLVSYSYTQTVTGSKFVITNPPMGFAPTFQIDFYQTNPNIAGAQWSLRLYSCMSMKLGIASKLDDWTIPQFDFEAFANAANNIGEMNNEA